MRIFRRLTALASLFGLLILASPLPAVAAKSFNPFSNVCSSATSSSAVCTDQSKGQCAQNDTSCDPVVKTITDATHVIALIAGIAAVIVLIVGALRYITSNGDSNGISAAKNTIIGALIGIVIIVVAQSLIVFIVDRIK